MEEKGGRDTPIRSGRGVTLGGVIGGGWGDLSPRWGSTSCGGGDESRARGKGMRGEYMSRREHPDKGC